MRRLKLHAIEIVSPLTRHLLSIMDIMRRNSKFQTNAMLNENIHRKCVNLIICIEIKKSLRRNGFF